MTDAEFHELKTMLHSDIKRIAMKIDRAIKEDESMQISIDTLGKYSDIVKDIAESMKDLCKASYYRTLHSSKLV